MKKIVMYKRLERDRSEYGRLIENHVIDDYDRPDASLNFRFDAILAVDQAEDTDLELVRRFFAINDELDPAYRVNALAILGKGYARYISEGPNELVRDHMYPESDMAYLNSFVPKQINGTPSWSPFDEDALYFFYSDLLHHLTLTVLNFKWQKFRYGKNAERVIYAIEP